MYRKIKVSVFFAVNSDECLLTRMQEMSLDYHFTVEQEVGSATHAFFGFNGMTIYKNGILFSVVCGEVEIMFTFVNICRNWWYLEN